MTAAALETAKRAVITALLAGGAAILGVLAQRWAVGTARSFVAPVRTS